MLYNSFARRSFSRHDWFAPDIETCKHVSISLGSYVFVQNMTWRESNASPQVVSRLIPLYVIPASEPESNVKKHLSNGEMLWNGGESLRCLRIGGMEFRVKNIIPAFEPEWCFFNLE